MRTIFCREKSVGARLRKNAQNPPRSFGGDEPHGIARYSGNECSTMC